MTETTINTSQLAYLQTDKGQNALPCWTDEQLYLNEGSGHIQPNSGKCMMIRYNAGIQPSALMAEDMKKAEGLLLAKACSTCTVMANTIAVIQILNLHK